MRAATFRGVRQVVVAEVPEPAVVEPTDAVVEVELAGLCGSDLHPYRGRERGLDLGTVLGHELTGLVVAVGSAVRRFRVGDPVVCPFSTSCGGCGPCRRRLSSRCSRGNLLGWVEGGSGLQGAQAQLVRVPFADATLVRRPDRLPPLGALLLGDVVSTGAFVARRAGAAPEEPVAIVGLGAVGLAALLESRRLGAAPVVALDPVPERLARAEGLGAVPVTVLERGRPRDVRDVAADLRAVTGEEGVASVIEAVGTPEATRISIELLRPGGTLAIAGVHTEERFEVSPAAAYDKNLSILTGRAPVRSFLEEACARQVEDPLPIEGLVTHRVPLSEAADAYRIFDERLEGCIKVVFDPKE